MANHKIEITTSPNIGDCIPKKMNDHSTFITSCTKNTISATLTPLSADPFLQTRKADTPIRIYSAVQTGANSQFGGEKLGLARVAYQVGMALLVNMEPIAPAARQAMRLTTSLMIFLPFISGILPDAAVVLPPIHNRFLCTKLAPYP